MRIINPASSLLAFVLACLGAAAVINCDACATAQSSTADTAYGIEITNCVQDASSRAEADACRARVKATFGLEGGAK